MNIQQLKKYWQDCEEPLHAYSISQLEKTKVNAETFTFLTTCGLPSNAAPSLSFSEIQENRLMTPNQVFRLDLDGLDDYLMFGSNGSGDPICIDTIRNNQIVYLNHDNYFEPIFINSNIQQFAVCLVKYRDFFLSLLDRSSNNFAHRKFSDREFEQFKSEFLNVDGSVFSDNSFWTAELDYLLWERDN